MDAVFACESCHENANFRRTPFPVGSRVATELSVVPWTCRSPVTCDITFSAQRPQVVLRQDGTTQRTRAQAPVSMSQTVTKVFPFPHVSSDLRRATPPHSPPP